jgi:hypothetical protein
MNYILKEIVLKSFMQIETLFEDSFDYNDAKTQYGTSIVQSGLFIHIFKTDDKIIKDSEKKTLRQSLWHHHWIGIQLGTMGWKI